MKLFSSLLLKITATVFPLIASVDLSQAQCDVDFSPVNQTILVDGVAGKPVCSSSSQVSIRLTNLQDTPELSGVKYSISYAGQSYFKIYYGDGNFTSITWSLSQVTYPVSYTITAQAIGCSDVVTLFSSTLSASAAPSVSLNASPASIDPSHVCENKTITLIASGSPDVVSYTWNSTADQTIHGSSFSPTQPGTYSVTATNQCGVTAVSNSIVVAFVPTVSTPSISLASGSNSHSCVGPGTSTYVASAANATGYSWSISAGSSSISSSGVVNWDPVFSGDGVITATAYGCGGSVQSTQFAVSAGTITVADFSGGGSVCTNVSRSLTLTATGSVLDDVWYNLWRDNVFVSKQRATTPEGNGLSSISWSQSALGTYKVTATGNGCTDIPMSGNAVITRKNPGNISLSSSSVDPTRVCAGDSFTLTASGGSNYQWSTNPAIDQPIHGSVFSPTQSATYSVNGIESICGTLQFAAPIVVTVNPLPDASISPNGPLKICSNCSQTINATNVSTYSYQWRNTNGPLNGTLSSYPASADGTYSVKITTSAGCSSTSPVALQLHRNILPTVPAIADQTLILPTTSIVIQSNASDADGSIANYVWTQTSGATAVLSGASTSALSVSNLWAGTFKFQLAVTDDFGEVVSSNEVTVQVNYPANNFNYVKETTVKISGVQNVGDVPPLSVDQANVHTDYYDGIGRKVQSVSKQLSFTKLDAVQPVAYDTFGREAKKYLPLTMENNGYYKANEQLIDQNSGNYINGAQAFYSGVNKIPGDTRPFAETLFERSPLNRPRQQFGHGQDWKNSNKAVSHNYLNNQTNEVILFTYDPVTGLISAGPNSQPQYYAAGQLTVAIITDEGGNAVSEYTDKLGHKVCKKVQSGSNANGATYAATYYIYDDLGNLVVVLPPEAVAKFAP